MLNFVFEFGYFVTEKGETIALAIDLHILDDQSDEGVVPAQEGSSVECIESLAGRRIFNLPNMSWKDQIKERNLPLLRKIQTSVFPRAQAATLRCLRVGAGFPSERHGCSLSNIP